MPWLSYSPNPPFPALEGGTKLRQSMWVVSQLLLLYSGFCIQLGCTSVYILLYNWDWVSFSFHLGPLFMSSVEIKWTWHSYMPTILDFHCSMKGLTQVWYHSWKSLQYFTYYGCELIPSDCMGSNICHQWMRSTEFFCVIKVVINMKQHLFGPVVALFNGLLWTG